MEIFLVTMCCADFPTAIERRLVTGSSLLRVREAVNKAMNLTQATGSDVPQWYVQDITSLGPA